MGARVRVAAVMAVVAREAVIVVVVEVVPRVAERHRCRKWSLPRHPSGQGRRVHRPSTYQQDLLRNFGSRWSGRKGICGSLCSSGGRTCRTPHHLCRLSESILLPHGLESPPDMHLVVPAMAREVVPREAVPREARATPQRCLKSKRTSGHGCTTMVRGCRHPCQVHTGYSSSHGCSSSTHWYSYSRRRHIQSLGWPDTRFHAPTDGRETHAAQSPLPVTGGGPTGGGLCTGCPSRPEW